MLISYAQNFEDVILWRALKHIDRGFYIDIGAQDPVVDSVSLAFYEHGWRGVHVEPTASYAGKLREARPDEEVIEAAIGSAKGKIILFEIPDTGLSTADEAVAARHEADGRQVQRVEVDAFPLSELLDKYRDRDINWLKIDVEGMEAGVIESWSPSSVRPWLVLIESTAPNSRQPSHSEWEPGLVALGYEFVHFDGLNRFYVHQSHSELVPHFGLGPNFFDDFAVGGLSPYARHLNGQIATQIGEIGRLHHHIAATDQERSAERAHLTAVERTLVAEHEKIAHMEVRLAQLGREILTLRQSTSWRVTAPLRWLARAARAISRMPKSALHAVLEHALFWIHRRPWAKAIVRRLIGVVPPLERRLLKFAAARISGSGTRAGHAEIWCLEPDPEILAEWRRLLKVRDAG